MSDNEQVDRGSKYQRVIKGRTVDIYDIAFAYGLDPARSHALKKLLCPGSRGLKDFKTDINEAIVSLERCVAMRESE